MTNVLLGIIGVILFIGLALAGALFLGEEFQKSSQRNRAMALAQMSFQISAAVSLSETETGREFAARTSVSNLLLTGYLRTLPMNPYIGEGGYPFRILHAGDLMGSGAGTADVVFVSMGSSAGAGEVCRVLNRQAGGNEAVDELAIAYGTDMRSMMYRNGGCFRMHDVGIPGEAGPHDYITFSKI
jgi:hypothetical protein